MIPPAEELEALERARRAIELVRVGGLVDVANALTDVTDSLSRLMHTYYGHRHTTSVNGRSYIVGSPQ